jgi:serine/threonine-protein kinase RsbW
VLANALSELGRLGQAIEEFGRRAGLSSQTIFELQLAANEIVTNVVTYAYGDDHGKHEILVRLAAGGGEATLTIEDDGRPFDPSTASEPELDVPLEERRVGGLGIHLVRKLADAIEYRRAGDRNVLVVRKRTPAS